MTFADIPAGAMVFVDANVFVYHFTPHSGLGPPCTDLLDQIENHHFTGFTSAAVVSDLAHRLMAVEALDLWGWSMTGMAHRLKRHPTQVQQLGRYRTAIDEIAAIPVQVLSISGSQVAHAADIARQFGLLMNDALIVIVMRDIGLTHIASNDPDFDRIPGITRYAPT